MREEEIWTWIVGVLTTVMAVLGLFLWAKSVDLGMALFGSSLLAFGLAFDFWLLKRHFDLGEIDARDGDRP
jgi:hypothetical protein